VDEHPCKRRPARAAARSEPKASEVDGCRKRRALPPRQRAAVERSQQVQMRAIVIDQPGDETVLRLGEAPAPALGPGELRIRVAATAVNRADLLQRQGLYPPPPGASPILGLECAGVVSELGRDVSGWSPGDRVMALLPGGGYAEEVVVDAGSAMRVPPALSLEEAAALPEVFLTVFLNVFQLGALPDGGAVLVHGGGSGIGTAAIQLVRAAGGKVVVTAGSEEKCARCRELGAQAAVNYRSGDFVAAAQEATGGRGVDVVLDSIGAPYLERNLKALAVGGRLVIIGLMGGAKAELPMGPLLARRLQVIGSTLRARPAAEKAAIVRAFLARFGARLEKGELRPVVDRVLPLAQAADAHRAMKASEHFGKIVLRVGAS
jgi:putative PIG3 family NAD(P)H quinone oxidoreductase